MMSMLEGLKGENCRRNCWIAGGVAGLVLFILALIFGASFFWALLLGAILGLAAAFYLMTQLCTQAARPVAATPRPPVTSPTPRPTMPTPRPTPAPAPMPTPTPAPAPTVMPVATAVETPVSAPPPAPVTGAAKPAALAAPRAGVADDLKRIKGVGPKLEKMLNGMGFYHFDQIAGWSATEIAWVDQNLEGFKGRVSRDRWVEQAQTLASGGATEFSSRVDKGGVY